MNLRQITPALSIRAHLRSSKCYSEKRYSWLQRQKTETLHKEIKSVHMICNLEDSIGQKVGIERVQSRQLIRFGKLDSNGFNEHEKTDTLRGKLPRQFDTQRVSLTSLSGLYCYCNRSMKNFKEFSRQFEVDRLGENILINLNKNLYCSFVSVSVVLFG